MNRPPEKPSDMLSKRHVLALAGIVFLCSFGLRCGYLMTRLPLNPESDEITYLQFAKTLNQHGVLGSKPDNPSNFLMPGYVFYLVPFIAWDSTIPTSALVVQTMLTGLACVAIFVLANRIAGIRAGLIAAAFATLYFHNIKLHERFLTDPLAATLLIFIMFAADIWITRCNARTTYVLSGLIGVVTGLAALVRVVFMPMVAVVCFVYLLRNDSLACRIRYCLVTVLAFISVFGIWLLRNQQLGTDESLSVNFPGFYWHQSEYIVQGKSYKEARKLIFEDYHEAKRRGEAY
ncbi:MAG: hypothetical protein P1U77_29270, partial [Rubripirellula sp.]|nr:hypothetical protein [Rubripirellula sp.]